MFAYWRAAAAAAEAARLAEKEARLAAGKRGTRDEYSLDEDEDDDEDVDEDGDPAFDGDRRQ